MLHALPANRRRGKQLSAFAALSVAGMADCAVVRRYL